MIMIIIVIIIIIIIIIIININIFFPSVWSLHLAGNNEMIVWHRGVNLVVCLS